jgi:cell division control protein 6
MTDTGNATEETGKLEGERRSRTGSSSVQETTESHRVDTSTNSDILGTSGPSDNGATDTNDGEPADTHTREQSLFNSDGQESGQADESTNTTPPAEATGHLNDVDDEDGDSSGLFDDLLDGKPIFENKEVLRPAYTPRKLPHREEQINNMATILVSALRGDTPSNILIYGKTGTGKTASAKFVSEELETTSQKYDVPSEVEYINCEVTDTQYRVLAQLANKFIENNRDAIDEELAELRSVREDVGDRALTIEETDYESVDAIETAIDELEATKADFEQVPMTGWPTDRVYNAFFDAIDYRERVVVIMLDEIDKLVEKSGDDTLYNLSRMNSKLERSRVSIIGISNDLKFTDFLDPRVKSSLGEEEIVFPPYDANQLRDILDQRADAAMKQGVLTDDVIPLCAAFAANEHGDARRALDLLRTAGELAERDTTDRVD